MLHLPMYGISPSRQRRSASGLPDPDTRNARGAQVRFYRVLAPNIRYRESVTPLNARQVEPATADVEADGPDAPNLRAGRRKGLCCTLKGIKAQRLKRVFNGAAQV